MLGGVSRWERSKLRRDEHAFEARRWVMTVAASTTKTLRGVVYMEVAPGGILSSEHGGCPLLPCFLCRCSRVSRGISGLLSVGGGGWRGGGGISPLAGCRRSWTGRLTGWRGELTGEGSEAGGLAGLTWTGGEQLGGRAGSGSGRASLTGLA